MVSIYHMVFIGINVFVCDQANHGTVCLSPFSLQASVWFDFGMTDSGHPWGGKR
jgi:hypothetical protein